MNTKKALLALTLVAAGLIGAAPSVMADDDRERQALRRAQLLMKQAIEQKESLEQEKAALTEQLAKLKTENDALKESNRKLGKNKAAVEEEGAAAKKDLDSCKAESAARDQELQTLRGDYARINADLQNTQQALAKTQDTVLHLDGDLKGTKDKLSEAEQASETCGKKNVMLYRYGSELIERYRNKGVLDALLQREPVTQLKQVEMENVVQDYATKLDQERVEGKGK